MILDIVIEAGNPADSARFLPMLERHVAHHVAPPRQTSADGGYASTVNLERAKALGVEDVAFHKKCRLAIEDMVKNRWVYRKLRNFRAGIEANISCLKRAFGLRRCTWRHSRLVHHVRSVLKQRNRRTRPVRPAGERRPMSMLASSNSLYPRSHQKAAQRSSPPTKNAAQIPANTVSITALVKKSPSMDGH